LSIAIFKLKIDVNTILTIKAYDKLADYCYSKLKIGNYILALGRINCLGEIEIEECENF